MKDICLFEDGVQTMASRRWTSLFDSKFAFTTARSRVHAHADLGATDGTCLLSVSDRVKRKLPAIQLEG